MTARMRDVEAREGEQGAAHQAAGQRAGHLAAQPEGGQAAGDEREENDQVVGLNQREELEQHDGEKTVEGTQRVPEQRRTERVMQQGRMPRKLQLARTSVDPPQVPDILE